MFNKIRVCFDRSFKDINATSGEVTRLLLIFHTLLQSQLKGKKLPETWQVRQENIIKKNVFIFFYLPYY